jgi:hypothetical protein
MGFIKEKIPVYARLTKYGKEEYLKGGLNIITHFLLSDSDINYTINETLGKDYTIGFGGKLGNDIHTLPDDYSFRSIIKATSKHDYKKVHESSNFIHTDCKFIGQKNINNDNLEIIYLNRQNNNDKFTNLFYS